MIDINLLSQQNVSTIEEKRTKHLLVLAFGGLSIVWTVVLGSLFLYGQALSMQIDSLTAQKTSMQTRLDEQKSLAEELLILKQKISGISYITKNRFDLPSGLKYVMQLFPPGIDVAKISMDGTGLVSMDLKGNDSQVVSSFVSKMGRDKVLKDLKLDSFRLNESSNYVFNISAQYGDKIAKTANN